MEPSGPSRWRSLPSWLLEGLARSVPWVLSLALVASLGACALLFVVLLTLTRLEHGLRRSHLALRWLGFWLLVVPFVLAGVGMIQGQAAYAAAVAEGSSFVDALGAAWRFLQGDTLEDWAPALVATTVLLAQTGTRVRLLGPRLTCGLAILLILSPLVEWPPLSESLSVPGLLAGAVPLGAFLGYSADLVEASIEARARRDEGRPKRALHELRESLVAALRRGERPWADEEITPAQIDHEALHRVAGARDVSSP